MDIGLFDETSHKAVTDTSAKFDKLVAAGGGQFIVYSNRAVHLKRNAVASTEDFPIPANKLVRVRLVGEDELHFIAADGEPDGDIWLSKVS